MVRLSIWPVILTSYNDMLNGRKLTILNTANNQVRISTTGEGFPDASFTLTQNDQGTSGTNFQEAYLMVIRRWMWKFEGEALRPQRSAINSYNNKKIVLRETVTTNHTYKHADTDFGSSAVTGGLTSGMEYFIFIYWIFKWNAEQLVSCVSFRK